MQPRMRPNAEVDKQWSWVIAFSCCFINCLLYGVTRLSGILMVSALDTFQVNRASAALPFSVSTSVRNLSGIFVGYLGQRFGLRNVIAVGCILSSLGAGLCFFVSDIRWIVVCWGGIFGAGFGLATCLLPLAINQHFSKHRGIASGISYSGSYIGSFVFPLLVVVLLDEYGLSGTFLVISGTFLNGLAAAMLFRSTPKLPEMQQISQNKSFKNHNFNDCTSPNLSTSATGNRLKTMWDQLLHKIKSNTIFLTKELRTCSSVPSVYLISTETSKNHYCYSTPTYNVSECELIAYQNIHPDVAMEFAAHNRNLSLENSSPNSLKPLVKRKYKTRLKKRIAPFRKLFGIKKRSSRSKQFTYFSIAKVQLTSFKMDDLVHTKRTQVEKLMGGNTPLKLEVDSFGKLNPMFPETRNEQFESPSVICDPRQAKFQLHSNYDFTLEKEHQGIHYNALNYSALSPLNESSKNEYHDGFHHMHQLSKTCLPSGANFTPFAPINRENGDTLSLSESGEKSQYSCLKDASKCFLGWFRLYAEPMFVVIASTMSLHTFMVVCMVTIIEDFAKDIGIPDCQVHYVLMVLSIADLIGSLTLGVITDRGLLSRCNFIIICFLGMAICQVSISVFRTFTSLLCLVAIYGIFESGIIITFPLLIAHFIPLKKQAVAVASSNILSSPSVLLVPLMIGYFRDGNGCYSGVFYSLAITSFCCSLVWFLAPHIFTKSEYKFQFQSKDTHSQK